jgi:cyclopropane fatty-acyl-phospholipid synthase-like methyltransferase
MTAAEETPMPPYEPPSSAPLSPPEVAVRGTAPDTSRGHGLAVILWLLEQRAPTLFAIPTTVALVVTLGARGGWPMFVSTWLAVPLVGIVAPLLLLVYRSHRHDAGAANWDDDLTWRDPADAARWRGKKIPMEIVYEAYRAERLDLKADLHDVMLRRNRLFRFCFTWGDVWFYVREFLTQNVTHSQRSDHADIAHVYNRGNDFYRWFLGDTMVYTSGIFRSQTESLEAAQERKLETVCRYVQMTPGDRHLDIGCGWGPLVVHAAERHQTHSTGITLAKEQGAWAEERARRAGVSNRVRIIVDDYRNLPNESYDKITCLEMAEHVGVKNFQTFLLQVRRLLSDDGIFYLQIAGLRRPWQYEDLVWGLFMGKYIFPGADASCPLGFVVSQVERAGFEVHRVENCGVHYSLTIRRWYENWMRNRDAVVAKYGERWFRTWALFLSWSEIIAAQGSSTVFMITMAKNTKHDKSSVSSDEAVDVPYSRKDRWIGDEPVATQQ